MLFDALLALALAVLALTSMSAEIAASRDGSLPGAPALNDADTAAVALALAFTLPVALRRKLPLVSFGCVVAAVLVAYATHYPADIGSLSALVVLYTVGSSMSRVQSLLLLLLALVAYASVIVMQDVYEGFWAATLDGAVYVAAWAVGRSIRYRRAYTAELVARAERLESERETAVRATLVEERSRIARELHDVVAHSLSVMTVQASAAQRTTDAARSREAMAAVESTGRAALMEMRRIVGVLREEGHSTSELSPSPGLADLPELVRKVREAGLHVEFVVEGGQPALSAGVDLTVYRIVQEALTNTLKHAGPASASVHVACSAGSVDVEVEDSGRGAASVAVKGGRPGHGLVGMQERVALFGGSLRVGPRPGGGYAVHARIPVEQACP